MMTVSIRKAYITQSNCLVKTSVNEISLNEARGAKKQAYKLVSYFAKPNIIRSCFYRNTKYFYRIINLNI